MMKQIDKQEQPHAIDHQWHALDISSVLSTLHSNQEQGLNDLKVRQRVQKYGHQFSNL